MAHARERTHLTSQRLAKRVRLARVREGFLGLLDGQLDEVATTTDPIFGLDIPVRCPGVPEEVLEPRNTWNDKEAYDTQARKLAQQFADNFAKYVDDVTDEVRAAGLDIG